MKKLAIILLALSPLLLNAQYLSITPSEVSKEVEFGKNATTAYLGIASTGALSGISVSSDVSWMTPSATNINLTNAPYATQLTITFNTKSLALGDYTGKITVSKGSEVLTYTVYLRVVEPQAWRAKYPFIMFNYTQGTHDPTLVVPERVGSILIFTTSNHVYISKGLTTNDWIKLAP